MVQPLKFGNGLSNPSHILLGVLLLTHVEIKDNLSPRGKVALVNISVHSGPLRIAQLIYHKEFQCTHLEYVLFKSSGLNQVMIIRSYSEQRPS